MSYGRSHRVLASVGFTAVMTASALAGPVAVAAPASPPVQTTQLTSGVTAVTSSTHRKLHVQLDVNQPPNESGDSTLVVTLGVNKALTTAERHAWFLVIPASALTVRPDGSGALDVPSSAISPFGKVSLSFSPAGSPQVEHCAGQTVLTTAPVRLHGTFFFDTHSEGSHPWGSVGSKTKKFTFSATNDLVRAYVNQTGTTCGDPSKAPCRSATSWEAKALPTIFKGSMAGHGRSHFHGDRAVPLSKPSGAERIDSGVGTTKPLHPVIKSQSASLSLVGNHGSHGSGVLTSSHRGARGESCQGGSGSEQVTTWNNGTYTNGKSPLRIDQQIFGPLKVRNGGRTVNEIRITSVLKLVARPAA